MQEKLWNELDTLCHCTYLQKSTPCVKRKSESWKWNVANSILSSSQQTLWDPLGPSINDVGKISGFMTSPLPHVGSFLVLAVGDFDHFLTPPPFQLPTMIMDGPFWYKILSIAGMYKLDEAEANRKNVTKKHQNPFT